MLRPAFRRARRHIRPSHSTEHGRLELGRNAEAVKTIDAALAASATLPISSVNQFMELRQRFATDADSYFRYAARQLRIFIRL